ncbi:MAG: dihydrolipoyl dehydrogenase [Anaerolineae bacterium]|nr:dihydrolipoyl dehydrogenase [Anaerolineae bacterium]
MANEYDVLVLGAGPGGYVAAIRSAQLGLKTAIVEKEWWGGVCLNVGCIPSKALLRNAELAHIVQHRMKEFGFNGGAGVTVDYGVAFKRSRQASSRLVKGVGFLLKKYKVDTYEGWGTIQDQSTVSVELGAGGTETLKTRNLILATGATVNLLPGVKLSKHVITYLEAILSETLPASAVIVGAGPIGVEFAYIMHNYGVDVTLVEHLPHLLPNEDEEVSAELEKQYKRLGVKSMTGTSMKSVEDTGSGVRVTVEKDGQSQVIEAEWAIMATGFKPRLEGYGLEALQGLAISRRGAIEIDERMATNIPGVWAVGDVTGKLMLAHVGSAMGIIAAENIAGVETTTLDYHMMPRCTYCQPQVASFGYTEAQAREAGYEIEIARFPFQANGKALGLGEGHGFVKLIHDKQHGELLGGHLIGPEVTELLPELTLAQKWELTAHEIARNVHAHPTLSEALMEAAHGLEGHYVHL